MEFRAIEEGVGYFAGPTSCGLIWAGGKAVLIDSGLDESTARKILRHLSTQGLELGGIINTHFHADHVGGNAFLVARTGAPVFAPAEEAEFVRRPILEPASLYGLAHPPAPLRNKFLMATPTPEVRGVTAGQLAVAGMTLRLLDIPGHSPAQLGVVAPGEILFCGDLFFGVQVLGKHGVPYNYDVGRHLASLEEAAGWIEQGRFRLVVPGHGTACTPAEAADAVAANRRRVEELLDYARRALREEGPLPAADLVARSCAHYGRQLSTPGEVLLMRAAVHACLSYLVDRGEAREVVTDNRLLWSTV